jgi:hypothetical protein
MARIIEPIKIPNLTQTNIQNTFTESQAIKKTSTSAFTVENDSGESIFNIDTDNNVVTIGTTYTAPTLDNEVATKKYVDDNSGGGTGLLAYISKTANYTTTTSDNVIECTANSFIITLYTAIGNTGRELNIKNTGNGIITIDGNGSQTIDGELTIEIGQYQNVRLVSNGANWIII